ncbi:MAG: AraC family transcriptional regulator [Alteromonadaceae bacterium]|nr:AraC family transcriptional regulator [Alteromonadaceae bacterium]
MQKRWVTPERQFQKWIGITPKHYQRIIRVTNTRNSLKRNPDVDLVDLALNKGFTDQAHMTREFKQIAQITPKKYTKLLKI